MEKHYVADVFSGLKRWIEIVNCNKARRKKNEHVMEE
jgi:hypothetical protein